ncbi:hypothetical protein ACNF36_02200 [Mycoplasma sp. 4463]|uniref:hypothetical protein n=1 Tax=Mycoplasma sp. 4463 TaxID=3400998 RepID=UPI003AAA87B9
MDRQEVLFIKNMGLSFEEFKSSEFNMLVPFKTPKKLSNLMSELSDEEIYNRVIYSVYNSVNALINSVVSLVAKKVDYNVEQFKNAIGDDRYQLLKKSMFHEVNNRYTNNAIPEVNSRLTLLGGSAQVLGTQREFVFAEQHLNPIAAKLLYDGEWDSLGVEIVKGLDKLSGFISTTDFDKVNEDIKGFKKTVETKTEQIDTDIRNLKLSAERMPSSMEWAEIRKNIQMDKVQANQILDNINKIEQLEAERTRLENALNQEIEAFSTFKRNYEEQYTNTLQSINEVRAADEEKWNSIYPKLTLWKENIDLKIEEVYDGLFGSDDYAEGEPEPGFLKQVEEKFKELVQNIEELKNAKPSKESITALFKMATRMREELDSHPWNSDIMDLSETVNEMGTTLPWAINTTEQEQFTGEYLDGFPVYKKLVKYETEWSNDTPSTLIAGVKDLVNIEGSFSAYSSTDEPQNRKQFPILQISHAAIGAQGDYFYVENNELKFKAGQKTPYIYREAVDKIAINVVIKYTKSTDTQLTIWDRASNHRDPISPSEYAILVARFKNSSR